MRYYVLNKQTLTSQRFLSHGHSDSSITFSTGPVIPIEMAHRKDFSVSMKVKDLLSTGTVVRVS